MWASRLFARSPAAVGLFIRFLFIGSRLCSTLLSDPASQRRPCASLSLLLHQDGKRTFTSKLFNMLGTQKKRTRRQVRQNEAVYEELRVVRTWGCQDFRRRLSGSIGPSVKNFHHQRADPWSPTSAALVLVGVESAREPRACVSLVIRLTKWSWMTQNQHLAKVQPAGQLSLAQREALGKCHTKPRPRQGRQGSHKL